MNKTQAKKEIDRLSRELEEHNRRYYVLNEPTISDKEYDDLMHRLIALESEFPGLKDANSPTQRVGTKADSTLETVRHKTKMYSLDNTYSMDELNDWRKRVEKGLGHPVKEYAVELKVDGVSAALTYKNGEFVLGATRGDGSVGENVTHSLRTVRSIPLKLRGKDGEIPSELDVRGEIYMRLKDFEKLNAERKKRGESIFANPRNSTAGSIKLLDSRITAERNLECFIHSFGTIKGGATVKTQTDFLDLCRHYGFAVNETSRKCKSFEEVIDYCREYQEKRNTLAYEVDGVVVKVNSLEEQKKLGTTLKSPRWAVAYKFPAHQVTTVVNDISYQVGRTGVLTPVADLEPVRCGGVTISRSTLHNFDEIQRLGVVKGSRVLVERAGDVIPKIIKVVDSPSRKGKKISVPGHCPACGGEIEKDSGDAVAYRCINPSCPKQLERRIIHFASRGAMDIEGLGEVAVNQLLDKKLLKGLDDIYALTEKDLLQLELFKEKKARNLLSAIEASKKQPLSRLLFGLGILNIGEKAASLLAQRFVTLENILKARKEDFEAIYEFGSVMAASAEHFFRQPQTKTLIRNFEKYGLNLTEPREKKAGDKLQGQKFVFTGELKNYSRNEAGKVVRQLSGEVVSSVSKNTDYVVAGENPGSKYEKAKSLGVKILTEKEFTEMIND